MKEKIIIAMLLGALIISVIGCGEKAPSSDMQPSDVQVSQEPQDTEIISEVDSEWTDDSDSVEIGEMI